MQIATVQIVIERDPMTKISKEVPAWELDCYQEKYPEKIEVTGEGVADVEELPDAHQEYARMANFFGSTTGDNDENLVVMTEVFGRGREGVEKLNKAIHAAHRAASKQPAKQDKAAKPAKVAPDALDDPAK